MPAPQLLGPLTVSSFSTALVSCFDNPVLYVLFQSGRSDARFLLVSFIRCSCPLEASFCIYFQHEDHGFETSWKMLNLFKISQGTLSLVSWECLKAQGPHPSCTGHWLGNHVRVTQSLGASVSSTALWG